MHILITDINNKQFIIKKSDIRRVYIAIGNKVMICFNGNKNTPIQIDESIEDFFNIYLAK